MAQETIFQHWIVVEFILPFVLIWTLVFGILQKTKLLGEDNKQIDSLVAFIIGFIFVSVLQPKEIVNNLILFLTIAIVLMFIGLLLWGFISGKDLGKDILSETWTKWVAGIIIIVAIIMALLWASGLSDSVLDLLFDQSWSEALWINLAFIVVIAIVLALVLRNAGDSSS